MSGIRCRSCARLQFANDPVDDNPIVCLRCAEGMRDVWSAGLRSDVTALRAENERLRERLDRIDAFAGERCEASGCRPDPCGPVEYHDVEGVPLCAECWQECLDEAAEEEGRDA